ncbi:MULTISPECIES: globin-coupled sensor protein [Pontibacillus]|uniref:Globin-coupled sensor protein n=1 Tax=Pontibacillus chungwhensis TaxID=265426 RepID=A0ABY8UXU2_9BACI|nr:MULTISPECIES: globin-coupled sensor protein [Pontibacillus]MCD5325781.1 globin-coupled sensor protein [Pontibacillus sp. HN14]WIF98314.1 globin-coupled sensor protein [Pontibacillus chungwhensis]
MPLLSLLTKREKRQHEEMNVEGFDVCLEVPEEIRRQLDVIGLNERDLQVMRWLEPIVCNHIDEITEEFYANITKQPNLLEIIDHHSTLERLKSTLKQHIEELFNGQVDKNFLEKRYRIAFAHVRVGLETKWYVGAFQSLLNSSFDILKTEVKDPDHFCESIQSLTKMLNFEQQLVIEAYEQEHKRLRHEQQEQAEELHRKVRDVAHELAGTSQETSSSITELTSQSYNVKEMANQGIELAKKSEHASETGKRQVEYQNENMENMEQGMERITKNAQGLRDVSKRITEVIDIVSGIAEQTNLLALNASIESARAGEYGKGFAVVAEEIRKLSEQTKDSTSTVADLIKDVNQQSAHVTESIDNIRSFVELGKDSMKETTDSFGTILTDMRETVQQNERIDQEIRQLLENIKEMDEASATVASSADRLTQMTEQM